MSYDSWTRSVLIHATKNTWGIYWCQYERYF
uniref:Uncharacterized protein n=1 Tax=Myoviridae sp. ct5Xl4 TaxID=2826613 RepID=A0A8S5M282_9CAUD|nr:MAG TPA: hypothetical protein [Myoviridae sp. ct5Xl4]